MEQTATYDSARAAAVEANVHKLALFALPSQLRSRSCTALALRNPSEVGYPGAQYQQQW